jgi:hypothetical protein
MVALDERTHDETPEFLFSKRKVCVVDGIIGFHFPQHVNKHFGVHVHVGSTLSVRTSIAKLRHPAASDYRFHMRPSRPVAEQRESGLQWGFVFHQWPRRGTVPCLHLLN